MSDAGVNRRQARRLVRIEEHGIVVARVRPGRDVTLIDVSAGGALIESTHRLLPGAAVDLHLETPHRRTTIRGCVLRCAVSRLQVAFVHYRGAIGFDRLLSWFADEEPAGYWVPAPNDRAGGGDRAGTTPHVP